MTCRDYHMVMKSVGIAELKSRLSEHLRGVRRGEPLTVLDRNTPVATIVPYEAGPAALVVRRPLPGAPQLRAVRLPPRLVSKRDIVDLLLADREAER